MKLWLTLYTQVVRMLRHGYKGSMEENGKVSIEKLCILSPYVEKPFNSKVIKSFVPELRSRKCFLCFGIPMLSIYELWTFYVHFTYPYHGYVTIPLHSLQ